jgi:multicomponent Na+:H+ antiporter subunit F
MPDSIAWTVAAAALMIGLVPCAIACIRSNFPGSLVAYELASTLTVMCIVALGEAFGRAPWFDLAIAMALLSLPGGLVFAVFLDRWL